MPNAKRISANPQLTIRLLGSPQLVLNDQPLDSLRRKNRALVYFLAAHDRPIRRENILTLFWLDHPRTAAQQILRTMTHDLRQRLGAAVQFEDEALALAPDVRVDVRRFESQLAMPRADAATLTAALDLYRGDFLDGFSLADTPAFEDWVISERERVRLLFIRGLTNLAQHHESQRNWRAALDTVERALTCDPLQEELQRAALRLQYLSGDRPGAIRRYQAFCRLLDDEMGVPPMPETRALYDAIITDALPTQVSSIPAEIQTTAPRAAPPKNPPFVGRRREMELLTAMIPAGRLILVEGEPGIGKTRLVEEFVRQRTHTLLLTGRAHELEQGLPYQPIIEALRGLATMAEWALIQSQLDLAPYWRDELSRLVPDVFPTQVPSDSSRDESRMWEALYRLIVGLAQTRQVVFFLDDLHWADASTLGWLGYLLRHPPPPGLILLATSRGGVTPTRLASLLQTLMRHERLARLPLGTLEAADVQALAEQLAPPHPESFSDWLTRTAEGNPFFVTEMARYAHSHALTESVVPDTIHNLIAARLARLDAPARRVFDAAAIIGLEFDASLVMRVLALDEDTVLDALDELRTEALIQPRDRGRFAFDHHLTMQTVLHEMSDLRRLTLHRHVAEALQEIHREQPDSVAGLIAQHWAQADVPARVAPWAFRAGRFAASVSAWMEAIASYEQALATETDAAQRTTILLALAQARFDRGDLVLASEGALAAGELAQAREDWARLEEAYLLRNMTLFAQGRNAEAIAVAQQLRQACPPDLILATEFMWGMALSLESTHPVEAEAHLRQAEQLLAAPRGFESRLTPAILKYQLAGALGQQGKIAEAIALYREALAMAADKPHALDLQRRILLHNSLAYYLHLEGDPSAIEFAHAGLTLAREKGTLTHQAYLLSTSGEIALAQNDLQGAQTLFAEGLKIAEQLAIPERIAGLTANLGRVAIVSGETDRARELLSDALARADELNASHLAVRIRIWLAPLLPSDAARQSLRAARATAESSGYARLLDEIARLELVTPV